MTVIIITVSCKLDKTNINVRLRTSKHKHTFILYNVKNITLVGQYGLGLDWRQLK